MGNLISGQYQCFINFVAVYKGSNSSKFAAIFMMHWSTKIWIQVFYLVLTHCPERGLEVVLGHKSHIFVHEQGNIAQVIIFVKKTKQKIHLYSFKKLITSITMQDQLFLTYCVDSIRIWIKLHVTVNTL